MKLGNIFDDKIDNLLTSHRYKRYVSRVTKPGNPICESCQLCTIMSIDEKSNHFGPAVAKYYTWDIIDHSITLAKKGVEPKDFWDKIISMAADLEKQK